MAYSKTIWENLPSTNTPINATNLNKIETELKALDDVAIQEIGSNANGSYIKYANGILICYNNINLTVDITNSYEGEYYAGTGDITFPVSFITNVPALTVTLIQGSALLRYNNTNLYTNKFSGYISKLQSKSNVSITLQYIAIGKWK